MCLTHRKKGDKLINKKAKKCWILIAHIKENTNRYKCLMLSADQSDLTTMSMSNHDGLYCKQLVFKIATWLIPFLTCHLFIMISGFLYIFLFLYINKEKKKIGKKRKRNKWK